MAKLLGILSSGIGGFLLSTGLFDTISIETLTVFCGMGLLSVSLEIALLIDKLNKDKSNG